MLIYSAIITPDGTKLCSRYRHDHVSHMDKLTNKYYFVDGGNPFNRCSANGDEKEITVRNDSTIEHARNYLEWGTNGPDGDQPLTYVFLKDLSTDHLKKLVDSYIPLSHVYHNHFNKELLSRQKHTNPILPVGEYAIFFYNKDNDLLSTEVWAGNGYEGELYSKSKVKKEPLLPTDIASAKGVLVRWDTKYCKQAAITTPSNQQ